MRVWAQSSLQTIISCDNSAAADNANRSQLHGLVMPRQDMPELQRQDGGGRSPPIVSSRDLLGAGREVIIIHGEERYRLLLTKSSKLILIK